MRAQVIDLMRINKKLKKQLKEEQKRPSASECPNCPLMQQNMARFEEETDRMQEMCLLQKQKAAEETNQLRMKVNTLQKQNLTYKVNLDQLQSEKLTIMKKLVHTMMASNK